ncbi:MAG: peptidoglycan DD-metalloendopeptidase family protein [Gammaproteobacteria bacterium]|nr:peptidoglycan DD-metalloendopeptidase family protein [Gammaproteobacteria bacterium]
MIRLLFIALLAGLLASAPLSVEANNGDKQRELEQVRKRIGKLRNVIDADVQKRDRVMARLRDIERLRGSVRSNLARLRTERESSEARHAALLEEQAERQRELEAERDDLAAQLKTAYINGRQERLRMLLNLNDAAAVGRHSIYYRYFVAARLQQVQRVEGHLRELERLGQAVAAEGAHLRTLETKREEELASLENALGERRRLLAELEQQISDRGDQLDRLQREEQALVSLLEELERVLADFPVESQQPFASLKGQLSWPVQGRIRGNFGQLRGGKDMRWNGVLIEAERGAYVRAVAHGRVAYADWLPGLGLLTVLEHDGGYLSLYGHNERLDKAAGDWVDAGEIIATVGDSGGQPVPALYFEIRRGRQPQDPHPWFRSKLTPAR